MNGAFAGRQINHGPVRRNAGHAAIEVALSFHDALAFPGSFKLKTAAEDFSVVPPFEIRSGAEQRVPFVFNSPHSGRHYPERFLGMTRLDSSAIRRSEDCYVEELFGGAVALGALALQLAGAAHGSGTLTRALFRRLLIVATELHLAIDALTLQLLLENPKRLIDIVIPDQNLQAVSHPSIAHAPSRRTVRRDPWIVTNSTRRPLLRDAVLASRGELNATTGRGVPRPAETVDRVGNRSRQLSEIPELSQLSWIAVSTQSPPGRRTNVHSSVVSVGAEASPETTAPVARSRMTSRLS